jgi:hypothetical protein
LERRGDQLPERVRVAVGVGVVEDEVEPGVPPVRVQVVDDRPARRHLVLGNLEEQHVLDAEPAGVGAEHPGQRGAQDGAEGDAAVRLDGRAAVDDDRRGRVHRAASG